MGQSAEAVAPVDPGDVRRPGRQGRDIRTIRCREIQRSMGTVPVVVADEGSQHPLEVPAVDHQQPVEALSPDRAHEALGDRVGPRRFDRCPSDFDSLATEDLVEGAAELGVVVADQEARRRPIVLQAPNEVSRLLCDSDPVRVFRQAGKVHPPA